MGQCETFMSSNVTPGLNRRCETLMREKNVGRPGGRDVVIFILVMVGR